MTASHHLEGFFSSCPMKRQTSNKGSPCFPLFSWPSPWTGLSLHLCLLQGGWSLIQNIIVHVQLCSYGLLVLMTLNTCHLYLLFKSSSVFLLTESALQPLLMFLFHSPLFFYCPLLSSLCVSISVSLFPAPEFWGSPLELLQVAFLLSSLLISVFPTPTVPFWSSSVHLMLVSFSDQVVEGLAVAMLNGLKFLASVVTV